MKNTTNTKQNTVNQPNYMDGQPTDTADTQNANSGKLYEYLNDYNSDIEVHDNYIVDFDAYEAMLISKTYDSVSRKTKNGITDSDAATMIIERAARVVGQLPDGEVTAAGKKDKGKAALMNILIQKYVYPNANAQRPFLDKIRLWEQYSDVYGIMPMYYDWDVSPSGYVGPNCWLWSPRNFVPQQGRYSIDDMDYVHAISYLGKKDIKDLIKNWTKESGWNKENLQVLVNGSSDQKHSQDNLRDSYVERQRINRNVKDRIMIVTRYESGADGKWITFSPDFSGLELRNIDNPHKNNKIPFVIKPCIPLFDNFYGLSDMARAKPLQFAKDGLINFYFQGIKMNIYPPTVVNAQGILKHTVSNEPGSIWEEIIPNSARRLETSTAGLSTYQAAMSQMSGALQNVFGTTTTQLSGQQAMSPQMGKTPEAIKYQSGRESARDNQNRAYLQQAIESLLDGMMSLFVNMGTEEIPIDLFAEDIKEVMNSGYTDIAEMIKPNESGQTGRIVIDPTKLSGVEYRFNMQPDSTIKQDKDSQKQSLIDIMDVLGKNANAIQDIQKNNNLMPNWQAYINSYLALTDVPGVDQAFIQSNAQQDIHDHPAMKVLESLSINFDSLPEDAKQQILQMTLGVQSQGTSPVQQEIAIKQQVANAKTAQSAGKVLVDHAKVQQETGQQAQTAPIAPETPLAPQSVNGMLYHDPAVHAVATDLHGMRNGTK